MKIPSIVIRGARVVLLAGLCGGMAGMARAQIPGAGQFGSQGQGGAPAGQFEDVRNVPMTQRGSVGAGYGPDTRNSPVGQRDADRGLTGGGQYPYNSYERRNRSVNPQRAYGGAGGQYPADPRNTPLGQSGAYGSQGISGTYGGSGSSYGAYGATGGYGAIGTNTNQSIMDSRNAPVDPLHTYGGPAAGQYSSDSRNPATGSQDLQQPYRPYGGATGGVTGAEKGKGRSVSGEPKRIYGGARTADDLAPGTENAAIRQFGAKGKEAATTTAPYPGGAENAASSKTDRKGKGRAETGQPASRPESGPESGFGRQADTKGGERALEHPPVPRNIPGEDGAQRGARPGAENMIPRGDLPKESLKKRAPASVEGAGEGTGSVSNQPGNAR